MGSVLAGRVGWTGGWLLGNYFDFKDPGPQLAGYEKPVVRLIVRDAVEDGFRAGPVGIGKQAGEVNPAKDASGSGGDAGDAVGVPDVGVDLAVDELELVELGDGDAVVADGDTAEFVEGFGIEEAERGGAVGEDDAFAVLGEAPALAGIGEGAQQVEGRAVIDERDVALPG